MSQGGVLYLVADHLGGTTHVLDSSGVVRSQQKYRPYGAVRSGGISETDVRYTGQRSEPGDAALGLYNYNARFYSPVLGRFLSSDVFAMDGLNRFTYAKNNPLRFVDPSGRCAALFSETPLPCSPVVALNFLVCAISADHFGTIVTIALGYFDLGRIASVHRLARLVVLTNSQVSNQFWNNFILDHNPYEHKSAIYDYYGSSLGQRLLDVGRRLFTPDLERASIRVRDYVRDYCSRADCVAVGLDLLNLGTGLGGDVEDFEAFLQGLGIYTLQVQYAWQEYLADPSEANYVNLWFNVTGQLAAFEDNDGSRELKANLLQLWIDGVCTPDPDCP